MGRHVKCLDPICGRKAGLEKKGANNVVDCAKHKFRSTVPLRCMRTGKTELNAMSCKKIAKVMVIIFASIITLEGLKRVVKLVFNKCEEM